MKLSLADSDPAIQCHPSPQHPVLSPNHLAPRRFDRAAVLDAGAGDHIFAAERDPC